MMEKLIINYWHALAALVAVIVWLVRLEGKVKQNAADIKDLKAENSKKDDKVNEKLDSMNDKLTNLCVSFAKITGYIERMQEEKNE